MSDWTPPAEGGPAAGTATPGEGKCVYTEDFLKAFEKGPQCQRQPADLEAPDDVDYWPLIGFTCPPGMQGGGGGGRRGGGRGGQWNGPPGGGGRGGRGGRGGGDNRWEHKGLPPDQQDGGRGGRGRRGGFGNYGAPVNNRHDPRLPQLQQTENKFLAIDKTKIEGEEKKQRAFKSILNKLTPQNFEKLLEQILAEGIDEARTLIGLIAQLFDKALTEPTFAELYATMCQHLSNRFLAESIEFVDPDCDPEAEGGPRMINFKRVLLNKCQEEFEKGDADIKAVEQEEIDEAEKKASGEAEKEEEKAVEEKEEGEVPAKPKTPEELDLEERRKIKNREDRMRDSRRRMLGNIRFIGELFKKEMLTARIMHTCIMKLLNEKKNPDEEDVEALCKLMATIGRLIDRPDAKSHMDAYFKRIQGLSANQAISSRHRFMCQDIMEMRSKGWRERRKQEGPKKIEDVHKDAAREAQNQARGGPPQRGGGGPRDFARGPGGPGGDRRDGGRGGRGGGRDSGRSSPALPDGPPRQMRPGSGADAGNRLGPRSDLGKGGRAGVPEPRGGRGGRDSPARTGSPAIPNAEEPAAEEKPKAPEPPAEMTKEEYEEKRQLVIEYFFDDKDEKAAIDTMKEWVGFANDGERVAEFLTFMSDKAFNKKGVDFPSVFKLFRQLPSVISTDAMKAGITALVSGLEDFACDHPLSPQHFANMFAGPIADGHLSFAELAEITKIAGPPAMEGDGIEEGYILEEGYALKIMGKTLKAVADTAGVARAAVVYEESGVNFADFCNDLTVDAAKVEKEFELSEILSGNPLKPVKGKIAELLAAEEGFEAADVATEMETAFDATIRASAEYVQEVGLASLNCAIPDAAKCDCDRPMEELDKFIPLLKSVVWGPDKDDKEGREIAMLFAAQRFAHDAGHPAGLLTRLFKDMYAGDVVCERPILQWRDDSSATVPGKDKALFEVQEYLVELAPEEDEDEEIHE